MVGEEAEDVNQIRLQMCYLNEFSINICSKHSHNTSDAWSHKTGVFVSQQVLMKYSTGVVIEFVSLEVVNFPEV